VSPLISTNIYKKTNCWKRLASTAMIDIFLPGY